MPRFMAYIDWILLLLKFLGGELIKMASETILKQKEAQVNELAEKFKEAKVILLTEYRGINVADDTKLRNDLRKNAISARKNKAVLHYAGRYKPWEFESKDGFNEKYYYYLQKTAFADVKMPQPSKDMKGKSIARQLMRLRIADFWENILG